MATFIGYNTIDQYKNYTLTDYDLIKRDLLNALNIKQGESLMRPLNGTTIWNFIFEPQDPDTTRQIREEIERIVDKDPRIVANSINIYSQDDGVFIELEVQTVAGKGVQSLVILFDENLNNASYVL